MRLVDDDYDRKDSMEEEEECVAKELERAVAMHLADLGVFDDHVNDVHSHVRR